MAKMTATENGTTTTARRNVMSVAVPFRSPTPALVSPIAHKVDDEFEEVRRAKVIFTSLDEQRTAAAEALAAATSKLDRTIKAELGSAIETLKAAPAPEVTQKRKAPGTLLGGSAHPSKAPRTA
mmetsp:Transcript_10754/g.32331  ORF Transcript_10754/g.32331 Transcript_10754/m.32331 type:complete len:124 (-) Transcript_10754:349-720(-)